MITVSTSEISKMSYQVNGLALRSDTTAIAFTEDRSYFSISYDDKILVFGIRSTDSHYEAQFRVTTGIKVTSLWWSGLELCYYVLGNSEVQRATIPLHQHRTVKNTVSTDAVPVFPKLRDRNIPVDQIDFQGLLFPKLVLDPLQHNLWKLPYELVQQITLSMSIGDAENAVEAMLGLNTVEEKERILRERCNPLLFLGELFKDPEWLLDVMRCTGTVITGSRATEYFCPGACVAGSDVDFYCPSDIQTVALFTEYLSLMGVKWDTIGSSKEEFLDYFAMGFKLLKGTLCHRGRIIDIQCIWSASQRRTATSNIFHFHSTPVQCFISGFAAVSLYDKYTLAKQAIHWTANDTNTARGQRHRKYFQKGVLSVNNGEVVEHTPSSDDEARNELKIVEKYRDRGFKFVEYFSQGALAHGNGNEIGCYGGRFRSVGDSGCRRVSFKPYVKHHNWHIPFDVYYDALSYISWYETEYKTTSAQGILDDDFPYQRKSRTHFDKNWSGPNQIFDPMESPYATESVDGGLIVDTPWLGDEVILENLHKVFYAYRYPC